MLCETLRQIAHGRDHITTSELARALSKSNQTIRVNYCRSGHAYGIRPIKVGGKLLWPVGEVAKLLEGGE